MPSVAVVGAGIAGLSTACLIKESLPEAKITIFADKFFTNTTSNGAAGLFRVVHEPENDEPTNDVKQLHKWCSDSSAYYWKLANSSEAVEAGALVSPLYQLHYEQNVPDQFFKDFVRSYRRLTSDDLDKVNCNSTGFPRYNTGFSCDTVLVECRYYLPYLTKRLQNLNVKFETRKLNSLNELMEDDYKGYFDYVVNCAGLNAGQLCGDPNVYPVQGTLVRVLAPWVKIAVMGPNTTHVYPMRESVVLGGTRVANSWDTTVHEDTVNDIIQRASSFFPGFQALKQTQIVETWSGLRPHRHGGVRLELETSATGIPIIHNYGHGGHGVSLGYGCAKAACELLLKFHKHVHARL